MSPLVTKEIRLLLPGGTITLLLALSIWLLPEHLRSRHDIIAPLQLIIPFLLCPLMLIMTVLGSFGREFSSGTFSMLLAQPIPRARIWWTKSLISLAAVLVVWFVWCYSQIASNQVNANLGELEISTALAALAMYSGGLWTVLLLRQVAAAFWFTVLTPAALLMSISNLLEHHPDKVVNHVLIVIFILYDLGGYWFAHWLFIRAQDTQWTGGTIALPGMQGLPVWRSMPAARRRAGSRAALWRKEFQLYQSLFIMALALLVIHLGVIVTRELGHFPVNSSLEFVLEQFWLLWFVIPFLAGCAAVAEERKFGTHESQLCLPAKRLTQFSVKLWVVLLLSLLSGAAMPLLMEGTRVLPDAHIKLFDAINAQFSGQMSNPLVQALNQNPFWIAVAQIDHLMPLLTLAGIATGIGLISFYISTLARNTLQALGPAVLGLILFVSLMAAAQTPAFASHPLWRGELIYLIGLPSVLLTLLALASWNFGHPVTGWQLWLRNLLALAASLALIVVTTAAIYHRAWEKLTPFEPAHGTARLALTKPASFNEHWNEISVRLPNGKIWMAHFMPGPSSPSPLAFALGNFTATASVGGYIEGSNWMTVKRCQRELVGIKTDGTLWVSEKPWPTNGFRASDWKKNEEEMRHLVQFGKEMNWGSLHPDNWSVLLVKKDGTLWRWGPTNFDFRHKQWRGLRSFTPQQLGPESNWAGFFESSYQTFLCKTDGGIWTLDYDVFNTNGIILKLDGLNLRAVTGLSYGKFRSVANLWLGFEVGIRDDGTFRICAEQHFDSRSHGMVWSALDLPIGHETNWLAVAGSGQKIITLKQDGSLWLWDFYWSPWHVWVPEAQKRIIQDTIPVRLGTHSDWISIASVPCGFISLAADGSLWFWPLARPYYYNNPQFEPLLDIPRKPIYLGNIFGNPD
ncbi:MAG TPA: hypothetical protein VMA35_15155 [Candidatus Sulfopaludibacter sp.]|nr:hypothetical protein [Candidatus Sulfopaludibacter sp.]